MLAAAATGRFMELGVLFVIVVIHELGHVAAALRYGWTVKEVKLLPFGGVAEVEEAGALPAKEEAMVALAGPAQHVWLAGGAWLLGQAGWVSGTWTEEFIRSNLLLCLFNLLPILPLDGGKLLQAWISLHVPFHKTLRWCAGISLVFSGGLVLFSAAPLLFGGLLQLNLLAIGLFLCFSNWSHRRNLPFLFLRFLVHRTRRSEILFDHGSLAIPIVLAENRPLSTALHLLMKGNYHLIYVMRHGKIAKVLPERSVIDGFLGRLSSGHAEFKFFR
jgi:stage IV sporulation protein FB